MTIAAREARPATAWVARSDRAPFDPGGRLVKIATRAAHRLHLWPSFAASLAFLCLWDGSGYTWGGDAAGRGAASLQVLRAIPGLGLRAHGIVLLLIGAGLVYGLGRARSGDTDTVRRALLALIAYSGWSAVAIMLTWIPRLGTEGGAPWGGPSKWGLVFTLAIILVATNEPGRSRPDARR
jgi:hypothetical protein